MSGRGHEGTCGAVAGTATCTSTGEVRLPPAVSRVWIRSDMCRAAAFAIRAASSAVPASAVTWTSSVSTGLTADTALTRSGTDWVSPRSVMTAWSTSGLLSRGG